MKGDIIKGAALAVVIAVVIISFVQMAHGKGFLEQTTKEKSQIKYENINPSSGDVQKVRLVMEGYTYKVEGEIVAGLPVEMEVDLGSVYGCMRDVVIPSFDVRKYVREGDNIIRFTPDKAGTFNIACSMNMGRGTFEVLSNPSIGNIKTVYEEPLDAAPAGVCGAGGLGGATGGCGCGAR